MLMDTRTEGALACAAVEVGRVEADHRRIWFRRNEEFAELESARVAIPGGSLLREGDQVLVTGGGDEAFVIGVLTGQATGPGVALRCGVRATTIDSTGGERLQVLSETGDLLFEYDGAARTSRVSLGAERLQFVAPAGGMDFVAGGEIRFLSNQKIQMSGELGVELHAGSDDGPRAGAVSVAPHAVRIQGPHMKVSAEHLDVQAVDSRFTARTLLGRIVRTRLVSQSLELVLGTAVQKAKHVINKISGWYETHATNTRSVVGETAHVTAGRVNVRAKHDVKIDGEQIHLG